MQIEWRHFFLKWVSFVHKCLDFQKQDDKDMELSTLPPSDFTDYGALWKKEV